MTPNEIPAPVRSKIEARILAALQTSTTVREAVTSAAFEADQEARANGWSDGARLALAETFATVAVDLVAAASAA